MLASVYRWECGMPSLYVDAASPAGGIELESSVGPTDSEAVGGAVADAVGRMASVAARDSLVAMRSGQPNAKEREVVQECGSSVNGDVTTRRFVDGSSISYDSEGGTAAISFKDGRSLTLSGYDSTTQTWSQITDSSNPDRPYSVTGLNADDLKIKHEVRNYLESHGFDVDGPSMGSVHH